MHFPWSRSNILALSKLLNITKYRYFNKIGYSFKAGAWLILTEVLYTVARLVQRPRVELQTDDGKDEDGEHDEKADLHEGREGLQDGLQHDL